MHLSRVYQGIIRVVKTNENDKKVGIKFKKAILFNKYPSCYIDLSSNKVYSNNKKNLSIGDKLSEDDYKKIEMYAEKCGITYLLDKEINKISGGERQLAFICRALVQEADLFIFDEPTASLDFGNQYRLFEIMNDIIKNGKTVIFTTHNPNQALEMKDYVIFINDGKIKTVGNSNDVITEELLKEVYGYNFVIDDGFIKLKNK